MVTPTLNKKRSLGEYWWTAMAIFSLVYAFAIWFGILQPPDNPNFALVAAYGANSLACLAMFWNDRARRLVKELE